jgi:hypothetical protein
MLNLSEVFDMYADQYLHFQNILNPPSKYRDVCAFLYLEQHNLGMNERDIIASSGHDEIYLKVDTEFLASAATEEDILYLIRCGVMYNEEDESLSMFV